MKSQHSFGTVPSVDVPRSTFNLSHGHKTCYDCSYLVPVLVQEVLPGDSFNIQATFFQRLATPLFPTLDNLTTELFYFFVPNRILWEHWEAFCGAQEDPADTIDYTIPKLDSNTNYNMTTAGLTGLLLDYMGLPWSSDIDLSEINALPFRGYQRIYTDWFRDQNLIDSPVNETDDGSDTIANYTLFKRAKKHDYFTSALPWPQKTAGTDEISIPLGTLAPVTETVANNDIVFQANDGTESASLYREADGNIRWSTSGSGYAVKALEWGTTANTNLSANLANATSATINELRQAFQLQRLLERDARGGTRYVEHLKAHWKVVFPDYRAQRPIFLGSNKARTNITPVSNTTAIDSANDPDATDRRPGQLSGFGTTTGKAGFTQSFVEHGFIISLINTRADLTYQSGVERFWTRDTRYDYFLPVLSGLGEMAILNREIFMQNTSADEDVFGYQEFAADYRFRQSRLSNLFNSYHANTIDAWHYAEKFLSLPALNQTFIEDNSVTTVDRTIAVNTEPHFILDLWFDIKAARAMPVRGVPGRLDHF